MVYLPALRKGSAITSSTVRYATSQPTENMKPSKPWKAMIPTAEEGRRAHIITGNGDAILPTLDLAASREVGASSLRQNVWRPNK
jgi:hypothetical protein